jgi:hypothetical protein
MDEGNSGVKANVLDSDGIRETRGSVDQVEGAGGPSSTLQ